MGAAACVILVLVFQVYSQTVGAFDSEGAILLWMPSQSVF
jgi:hypothetical protein